MERIEGQMFGSALYDPEAPWRAEPATDAQYRHLSDLSVDAPRGLTKGEASDMISAAVEPNPDEVEFLKFFGVTLPRLATQLDAKRRIADIVRDPANKLAWDARPATSEQKEIIRSVDGTVPRGITSVAADKLIRSYWDHDEKSHRYEVAQDAVDQKENREAALRDLCDTFNSEPSAYGLKRVSLKMVKQAVAALEDQTGYSFEELESDAWFFERVAEEIRQADPTKASAEAKRIPEFYRPWASEMGTTTRPAAPAASRGVKTEAQASGRGSWLGALITAIILLALIGSCSGT
jgi:hypothetical protein